MLLDHSREHYEQTAVLRHPFALRQRVHVVAAHIAVNLTVEYPTLRELTELSPDFLSRAMGYLVDRDLVAKSRNRNGVHIVDTTAALDWAASNAAIVWTKEIGLEGYPEFYNAIDLAANRLDEFTRIAL
jgi:hypothetical protein